MQYDYYANVNLCMLCWTQQLLMSRNAQYLNANANFSLDSNANANANANATFQERIQMQIFWGRIQMQMQMFWLHICKCIWINFKCLALY